MSALHKPDEEASEPASTPLLDRLLAEPHRFELSTALRVAESGGADVAIVSDPSLALAPSAIVSVRRRARRILFQTPVAGMVGALGNLPPAYTEIALAESRRRSPGFLAFLDMFGDRMVRLFADALEKYRLPRLLRWRGVSGGNRFTGALLALAGLRDERLRALNPLGDEAVLRHAGLFADRTRNASALAAMLRADSGLPVRVEQFRGRWLAVAENEQTQLGAGAAARLGVDAMAGARIKDHAGAFRVVIGPVAYADYLSLEPGSPRLETLMATARLYAGVGLRFDVQVVLRKEDVPRCRLGDPANPPKLGWNTWARSLPMQADSGDAVIAAPQ